MQPHSLTNLAKGVESVFFAHKPSKKSKEYRIMDVRNHIRRHFAARNFGCTSPGCSAAFTDKDLRMHEQCTHEQHAWHYCEECEPRVPFKTNYSLVVHQRTHGTQQKINCPDCGNLPLPSSLETHRRSHCKKSLLEIEMVLCDECGFTVLRKEFSRHVEELHRVSNSTRRYVEAADLIQPGEFAIAMPPGTDMSRTEKQKRKKKEGNVAERFTQKLG
jgi:hypothetical protein